jgi:predicted outer membrane repeat protein
MMSFNEIWNTIAWRYLMTASHSLPRGSFMMGVFFFIICLVPFASISAATFNPGCNVANLVANVATAGSNAQADTINLAAGCTYTLTSTLAINADSGNLLTINGNGATISGNNAVTVLVINSGASVVINNATISGGNAVSSGGGGIASGGSLTLTNSTVSGNSAVNGGGIYNVGSLILTNSIVSDNLTTGSNSSGGGIYNVGGTVTLTNSTVSTNSAFYGGGIYGSSSATITLNNSLVTANAATQGGGIAIVSGTLTLANSTVSENSADFGGGILSFVSGTVTATNSTVRGNSAAERGGGIYINGTVTLTNSTVSGNAASTHGGGIELNSGTVTLNDSTVSGNDAATAGGGINASNGTLTLKNSIVANSTSGGSCSNTAFATLSISFSVIEGGGCAISNGVNGNKTGDPNLGTLTGNPAYHPLLSGSIAMNAGSNALIPAGVTTDQAGNPRIQGGIVDIGSYESNVIPTPTFTPTTTPPAPDVNLVTNGTFANGLNGWTFYDSTRNVTNGELVIAPTAPGGGFYQSINYGSGGEIFEVNFRARNSSLTQKTLNIIVRDSDFVPSYNCVFGMTANTPFQYYRMRFDTSEGFIPMVLQAAITGDSTLGLVIDDITLARKTGLTVPTTECTVSPPANTELVFNGAFDAGTGSWAAFNATMNSVNIGGANGSIMQIGRNTGTTYGGFYQYSPYSAPANAVFQFNFQIGNQSAQARVINMLVRSEDWTDMHSCFITVPANTPLTNMTILLKTTKAWSNIVMQGWIQVGDYVSGPPPFRFDNISLQYLPSSGFSGSTQCPGPIPMPQRMTDTPSPTMTPSLTATFTPTATNTPTVTSTETALPTASETPTDIPTLTPEPPTLTPLPTDTVTDVPTLEPPTPEPPSATPEPPTNTPELPPEATQDP